MKILQSIILLLFVSFALNAQKTYDFNKFDEIIASGNVDVILRQGETCGVEVFPNDNEEHNIKIHVNEGILKINLLKSLVRGACENVSVIVTFDKLRRIKAYAGAEVEGQNVIRGDKLTLRLNSGATMVLDVEVDDLEVVVSEGSELEINGTTKSMDVRTSSGGILEAFDLQSDYTYVTSNTGGEAEVVAKKRIEAKANTGGRVEYKGKPEETRISDFLTGTVKRI
mgnify:CR=1 FL=1